MDDDGSTRDKKPPTRGRRGAAKSKASSWVARPEKPQRRQVGSRALRRDQARERKDAGGLDAASQGDKVAREVSLSALDDCPAQTEDAINAAGADQAATARNAPGALGEAAERATSMPEDRGPTQVSEEPTHEPGLAEGRRSSAKFQPVVDFAETPSTADPGPQPDIDLPSPDALVELAGLAERGFQECMQSLRSLSEARALPELLERQSQHMILMTEIWMRQARRSLEVFSSTRCTWK